jgi:hypothetical protein
LKRVFLKGGAGLSGTCFCMTPACATAVGTVNVNVPKEVFITETVPSWDVPWGVL